MRFFITGLVSALAAMASAYTDPDYSQDPTGNAILKPGLGELVPVGKPYTITWDPTTKGPVSLVLLRGPSTNVQPKETIVESTPNTGTYVWTPSADLEPDTTHYGILLVVEGTGQYQYSTQFGIKNPEYDGSGDSTPTASPTATPTETSTTKTSTKATITTTTTTESTESTTAHHTTSESTTADATTTTTTKKVPETTTAVIITTTLQSSPIASQTPSSTPTTQNTPTGAASRNALSMGAVAVGIAAVLAF